MNYVEIGHSKSQVSQIVLGLMRIPQLDEQGLDSLLRTALDAGINMLDIADIYSRGRAEELLGQAFARGIKREDFYLQSKCGIVKDPLNYFDFSKEHIIAAVEGSLQRLKTDHLDCLLLHRPDALMEPEEVQEAFAQLYEQGKVLDFGVSNFNPAQIDLLQSGLKFKLCANQVQLSLCHTPMLDHGFNVNLFNEAAVGRDGGVLEYCRLHDIVIQAWSVLQHGFFGGVFIGSPAYAPLNAVLERIASEQDVTPTAVALSWILRYPGAMQAVIGTTRPQRVLESVRACEVTLSRREWYELYTAAGNKLP